VPCRCGRPRRRRQRAEEAHVARVALERALAGRLAATLSIVIRRRGRAPRRPPRIRRSPCSGRVDEDAERATVVAVPGGTSPYLVVGRSGQRRGRPSRIRWADAQVSMSGATAGSGTTRARMAVSGQAATQAMQPTHLSSRNSGMRGARRLKSRVAASRADVERARPASAGARGRPRHDGRRHDRGRTPRRRRACRGRAARRRAGSRGAPWARRVLEEWCAIGHRSSRAGGAAAPAGWRVRWVSRASRAARAWRGRGRSWTGCRSAASRRRRPTTSRWMWCRSIRAAATASGVERRMVIGGLVIRWRTTGPASWPTGIRSSAPGRGRSG
jgi:hypothetical protein